MATLVNRAFDHAIGQIAERVPLETLALPYARARSLVFTAESLLGPLIDFTLHRRRPHLPTDNKELFQASRASLEEILQRDVANIKAGLYPVEVLKPENPVKHLLRFPKLLKEGVEIARRRRDHSSGEFSERAKGLLEDAPDYYHRNFHFQGDGYLSDDSAELYEHQVEVLFAGSADAMRRLIIAPMKKHFNNSDGEGLKFLEVGAGTGRATKFVRLAFPKAKIVSIDLSSPYLKKAQRELSEFARHDFVEADGAKTPFQDASFDAVYSVFLFHELPMEERKKVVAEGMRLLKANGFYGLVDSLQLGDVPLFDQALAQFPVNFHEPFYKNYIKHPMNEILADAGLKEIESGTGFYSKWVVATKQLEG
jgi:ubiquinone/menaquinone biosynthesis C-methylase UbiE